MRLMTVAALLLTATLAAPTPALFAQGKSDPGIKWGPAPAVIPAGAEMAVMQGDPSGTGLFTVRLRLPNGYKFPPHTHPTDEHVTVISGSFSVGMGKSFDASKMMTLRSGGFVTAPANEAHYAVARGVTVVQVHAIGPFAITYVNPADTPKASTRR
jgi:quercetin dioxygenase-like cupin family protein